MYELAVSDCQFLPVEKVGERLPETLVDLAFAAGKACWDIMASDGQARYAQASFEGTSTLCRSEAARTHASDLVDQGLATLIMTKPANGNTVNGAPARRVVVTKGTNGPTGMQTNSSLSDRQIEIARVASRQTGSRQATVMANRLGRGKPMANRGVVNASAFRGARGGISGHVARGGVTKVGRGLARGGSAFRGRGSFGRGFVARNTFRGGRGGFRGGRGRGGRGGAPPSKEALDKELESFMMKDTKYAASKLDNELEEYMAQDSDSTPMES
ncbi:hypothetical protein SpCBS45565_g06410 [Spizellomyces sp. 'palustris']|nr:hypothetical protein SpCBS45565_g06410 [Spizellomyces sp. 'palustris']